MQPRDCPCKNIKIKKNGEELELKGCGLQTRQLSALSVSRSLAFSFVQPNYKPNSPQDVGADPAPSPRLQHALHPAALPERSPTASLSAAEFWGFNVSHEHRQQNLPGRVSPADARPANAQRASRWSLAAPSSPSEGCAAPRIDTGLFSTPAAALVHQRRGLCHEKSKSWRGCAVSLPRVSIPGQAGLEREERGCRMRRAGCSRASAGSNPRGDAKLGLLL